MLTRLAFVVEALLCLVAVQIPFCLTGEFHGVFSLVVRRHDGSFYALSRLIEYKV